MSSLTSSDDYEEGYCEVIDGQVICYEADYDMEEEEEVGYALDDLMDLMEFQHKLEILRETFQLSDKEILEAIMLEDATADAMLRELFSEEEAATHYGENEALDKDESQYPSDEDFHEGSTGTGRQKESGNTAKGDSHPKLYRAAVEDSKEGLPWAWLAAALALAIWVACRFFSQQNKEAKRQQAIQDLMEDDAKLNTKKGVNTKSSKRPKKHIDKSRTATTKPVVKTSPPSLPPPSGQPSPTSVAQPLQQPTQSTEQEEEPKKIQQRKQKAKQSNTKAKPAKQEKATPQRQQEERVVEKELTATKEDAKQAQKTEACYANQKAEPPDMRRKKPRQKQQASSRLAEEEQAKRELEGHNKAIRDKEAKQAKQRREEADRERLRKEKEEQARQTKFWKQKVQQAAEQANTLQKRLEAEQANIQEHAQSASERRSFWRQEMQFEQDAVAKIQQLLAAEVCRSPLLDYEAHSHSSLLQRFRAQSNSILQDTTRKVFVDLFPDRLCIGKSVVMTKGAPQQRAGQEGIIKAWDTKKGKFLVELTTSGPSKKTKQYLQQMYLLPEHLEAGNGVNQSKHPQTVSHVRIPCSQLDEDADEEDVFACKVKKATIDELLQAKNVDQFLDSYAEQRKQQDLDAKQRQRDEEASRQRDNRRIFWEEKISVEKEIVDLLILLLAAEFCRQIRVPHLRETLLNNAEVKEKLKCQAEKSFLELYPYHFPSRIRVKDPQQQKDLKDRIGSFKGYEDGKDIRLRVVFENKSKKAHQASVLPEDAEPLSGVTSTKKQKKKQQKQKNPVSLVFVPSLYQNVDMRMYEISKATVEDMRSAECVDDVLASLTAGQDQDDARRQKEQERVDEEERRRAEKKQREEMEWRRREAEFRERTERLKEMQRQRKAAQRDAQQAARAAAAANNMYDDEEESYSYSHRVRECQCPECRMEREFARRLFEEFLRGRGGRGFPAGGGFYFVDDDSDSDSDWNDEFDRMHEAELAEKKEQAAELLGIDADVSEEEINRAFRRLSLKFHPDKFRPENHEAGTTKEDAEEHFKRISDARDTMLT